MRKKSSVFHTGFVSEAGSFGVNKDYFAYAELDDFACWVAASAVTPDTQDRSAEKAVHGIFEAFSTAPALTRSSLRKYIAHAQALVKAGAGTTGVKVNLAMVVSDYAHVIWAVAGNARVYHFRNRKLFRRSRDHSIAQMLADAGKINSDEINSHVGRNDVVQYLGKQGGCTPYISARYPLAGGDSIVLCTAGFWEHINDAAIGAAVQNASAPAELIDCLEETVVGKQHEMLGNYTAAAVFVGKVFTESRIISRRAVKTIAASLLALVAAGGLELFGLHTAYEHQARTTARRERYAAEQQAHIERLQHETGRKNIPEKQEIKHIRPAARMAPARRVRPAKADAELNPDDKMYQDAGDEYLRTTTTQHT